MTVGGRLQREDGATTRQCHADARITQVERIVELSQPVAAGGVGHEDVDAAAPGDLDRRCEGHVVDLVHLGRRHVIRARCAVVIAQTFADVTERHGKPGTNGRGKTVNREAPHREPE